MKAVVDRAKCVGVAACVAAAPGVFQLDGEQKAVVVDQHGEDEAAVWKAAEACPVEAIILLDEDSGEQLFP